MFDCNFKETEIIKIDLHKMKVWEATNYLNMRVLSAPRGIKEIVVIHGYHNGTALMNMVRQEFSNPRVKRKLLSLNQGVTSFILQ